MVYVSLADHFMRQSAVLPRFAQPPHEHNAVEWVLLILPAVVGWAGAVGSLVVVGWRLPRAQGHAHRLDAGEVPEGSR